jgi:hypothetical protein
MSKCKYCGFDSEEDSIVAEGAPCGTDGCMVYTCCEKTWKQHCKKMHPEYYKENFK